MSFGPGEFRIMSGRNKYIPWKNIIHSSFSHQLFLWGWSQAAAGLEISHGHINLRQLFWLHTKAQTSKVGDVFAPPKTTSWPFAVGVASRTLPANLCWEILDTWSNQRSWVSRFGKVVLHSELYEFHSCGLRRKVSHRELCRNPTFAACTWDIFLLVISQASVSLVRTGRKTDLKPENFVVIESCRFVTT